MFALESHSVVDGPDVPQDVGPVQELQADWTVRLQRRRKVGNNEIKIRER